MASFFQSLKKPLTSNGFIASKMYSTSIANKSVKPVATANVQGIHVSAKQNYPQAEPLPLPANIDVTESIRFSPQRARDITSTIATNVWNQRAFDITVDSSPVFEKLTADPHVDSYDCSGSVSLNSSMQSNVPSPFGGMHNFTHLNMPGGQWSQNQWRMSQDLHSSHYTNLRREVRQNMLQDELKSNAATSANTINQKGMHVLKASLHGNSASDSVWMQMMRPNSSFSCLARNNFHRMFCHLNVTSNLSTHRMFSEQKVPEKPTDPKKAVETASEPQTESVALTPRAKLKNAIKDYGSTVLIFHIAISLVSLGLFYQLVNSGIDMVAVMEYLGLGSTSSTISNNVTSGASTFVVAYAIHKVFAPIRISITLISAPFIVRYLRSKGILAAKLPKKP